MRVSPHKNVGLGLQHYPTRSPKVGASIFIDSFQDSNSHGYQVEAASAEVGENGPVHRYHQRLRKNNRETMPHVEAARALQSDWGGKELSPEEGSEALDRFIQSASTGNLRHVSQQLQEIGEEGFQNSVVNISQGLDALALLQLATYPLGKRSKLPSQQRATYEKNLYSALSFQPKSLHPGKVKIERDDALLQRVKKRLQVDSDIQEAVQGWNDTVRQFESDRNSVVVAAGNSGKHFQLLDRLGFQLDGSEDHNLLAVDEVTTVGAGVCGVSSPLASFGPEVDLLASGEFEGKFGTSYASPKVANLMRMVHLSHPEYTSDEVEATLKVQLCPKSPE